MTNTITKARIYEAQGLKDDAVAVYKAILKNDSSNKEALETLYRLGQIKQKRVANAQMKGLFLTMSEPSEVAKFKEWLVAL